MKSRIDYLIWIWMSYLGRAIKKFKNIVQWKRNIFIDDVFAFLTFLVVTQKFKYICLYIFHIMYLEKVVWQLILTLGQIFNIFPSAVESDSFLNIVTNNCSRETTVHISNTYMSERVFTCEILSQNETRPGMNQSMSLVKFLTV